jgi:dTDP-4-dehydrorhamnose reductase
MDNDSQAGTVSAEASRRVAIIGSNGQLGRELVRAFGAVGATVLACQRPDFDITNQRDVERLADLLPDAVVNAAAWTDVDGCARDPTRALQVNGEAAGWIARAADRVGALMVQVSTNEVFDGEQARPYREDDEPAPVNAYGESKLAGERFVAESTDRHLIVRSAWIYGGPVSFPAKIRAAYEQSRQLAQKLRVVADEFGNPTPADELARRIIDAVLMEIDLGNVRVLHLAGEPAVSRYDWARAILGIDAAIEPISQRDYQRESRPPRRAVLDTTFARSTGLPPIRWSAS